MESGRLQFGQYCPASQLRPFIRNYWSLQVSGGAGACRRHRVIPDGCIDIIFSRRSPTGDFKASVVVTMTRPIFEELGEQAEYLGVRFAPGGWAQLLKTPASELADRIVPLDSSLAISSLMEQLADAPDVSARLQVVEQGLCRLAPDELEPAVAGALDVISASGGRVCVTRLARLAGWSERHLRRVFQESVGVGPKVFCEIARFKSAARQLRQRSGADLLQIALEAGYYDQAHFIHAFNRFYGASPAAAAKDPEF